MNKISIGLLSAAILLNTACSPKHEETPGGSKITSSVTGVPGGTAVTAVTAVSSLSDISSSASSSAVSSEDIYMPSPTSLTNNYWKLLSLLDVPVEPHDTQKEAHIFLTRDDRVAGSDGCNNISGSYQRDDRNLSFSDMAGTKMACVDAGDHTQLFSDVLTKTTHYTLDVDVLELRDASDNVIARFQSTSRP